MASKLLNIFDRNALVRSPIDHQKCQNEKRAHDPKS